MKIKAAIFDMDGTLVDSLVLWDVFWREAGIRFLNDETFRPSEEDDKAVRTITLRDAMHLIHDRYGLGADGEELFCFVNDIITDFYATKVPLKEGVKEFLDHCRAQSIRMCIASATVPELIEIALKHCGIEGYFEKIFSCSVLGKGKEEPDIYLAAQAYFGAEVNEICVFEDSLTAIETANRIGMHTVAIYDRYNFGQERMKEIADVYIAEGETLAKLLSNPEDMK